ncbi:MAG: hypothetical protein JO004_08325 [Methylobacteriaceae bacterium]|nr:hypothetical protein [Methylobacteriaceae bacterium]
MSAPEPADYPKEIGSEREFNLNNQTWFAEISGDSNPIHLDAVAARRTLAGRPIVHGIHILLWTLNSYFSSKKVEAPAVRWLRADFENMLPLHQRVRVRLDRETADETCLVAMTDDLVAVRVWIGFGAIDSTTRKNLDAGHLYAPREPLVHFIHEMQDLKGEIATVSAAAEGFPDVTRVLGKNRTAALARSSYLVGMVCPGMHSIYKRLSLKAAVDKSGEELLAFEVKSTDTRFGLVRQSFEGGGWSGEIDSILRPAPVQQRSVSSLTGLIPPTEFRHSSVLVIGGSRGLGELIAKVLATGGAQVTITFQTGKADALRVQSEIIEHYPSCCEVIEYDIAKEPEPQLRPIKQAPTHVYYMATPKIFAKRRLPIDYQQFRDFLSFYVFGFNALVDTFRAAASVPTFFYPSSVLAEDLASHFSEYSMAKLAGEMLCENLRANHNASIVYERLPGLPTDQTQSLLEMQVQDPIDILLPLIRAVQSKG